MAADPIALTRRAKHAGWRRWLGILLRSAHLAAVTLMGAALLGAPDAGAGAPLALATGLALLASEWADERLRLRELAGLWVLLKLALLALAVAWPAASGPVFWAVLGLSAVLSHAPRGLRHWPRR